MRPPNYGKSYPAEVLSVKEIHSLLSACGRRGSAGIRNRALIMVMWRCGLRIAEVLALRPKDVSLDGEPATITVLKGKGCKRRVVGIDPEAVAVLELWLARRRELGVGPGCPVFCVISRPNIGAPVQSSCVREALKDLAVKAKIDKRVHPHGLRHTYAAHLARSGVPVHMIQRLLGHNSLATTARYVDHLEPLEAIRASGRAWAVSDHEPPSGGLAAA